MFGKRDGEQALAFDPATEAADAHLIFIGHIASPWKRRGDCPKNMRAAREAGHPAGLLIAEPYRPGLAGLEGVSHVAILTWLHHAPRNLIVQKPRHAAEPKGVFALRSPVRPNPVGLHVVRLTALDIGAGRLELEAIDVLDGTPVIDIKPYFASTDAVPEAVVSRSD
jgi:tRNA-Thr(GGU) m(6)t(6)A37 methyltransferase TsaA